MNELAYTQGLRELALFAGAGGGILGGHLLGWRTVCAVEWADYPRRVLLARQRDGILPRFPIWDDVQTFDGKPWKGRVDVVSGGFPCQDISCAGKGEGITGERSGMWAHMARIIGEVEPEWVLVENSPLLTSRGLDTVLRDLAKMGYDAEWGVLGAIDAGGPHKRDRIWIVARRRAIMDDTKSIRRSFFHTVNNREDAQNEHPPWNADEIFGCGEWWKTEPGLDRMADGVADRVDRVKAIGNGQVPFVAALAFLILTERARVDRMTFADHLRTHQDATVRTAAQWCRSVPADLALGDGMVAVDRAELEALREFHDAYTEDGECDLDEFLQKLNSVSEKIAALRAQPAQEPTP